MEFGIYSFAEVAPDPLTGRAVDPAERLEHLLEEIELADRVGLDVFGVGEHHRADYAVSAPAVVLAAAAVRTRRIRLTSAVNVLSSDDPIRVFQQFATVDLLSRGRAEIMAGRGSFIESFPLFGYDLDEYDALFAEKLELLLALRERERITWRGGKHTPAIHDRGVHPRPVQVPLPVWIAIGGTPQSAVRAGVLGLPLALAIIGGAPERFVPFIDVYREAGMRAGHEASRLKVSINSHGLIAETSADAARIAFPPYLDVMGRIGRERGWGPPTRAQFDAERQPRGALLIGDAREVVEKLVFEHSLFRYDRFLIQFSVGTTPHQHILRSIELFGTEVVPAVKKALGVTT